MAAVLGVADLLFVVAVVAAVPVVADLLFFVVAAVPVVGVAGLPLAVAVPWYKARFPRRCRVRSRSDDLFVAATGPAVAVAVPVVGVAVGLVPCQPTHRRFCSI